MTAQTLTTILVTLVAGWLMVGAGLGKRRLVLKRDVPRRRRRRRGSRVHLSD
jgi:hypothetical protein